MKSASVSQLRMSRSTLRDQMVCRCGISSSLILVRTILTDCMPAPGTAKRTPSSSSFISMSMVWVSSQPTFTPDAKPKGSPASHSPLLFASANAMNVFWPSRRNPSVDESASGVERWNSLVFPFATTRLIHVTLTNERRRSRWATSSLLTRIV